MDQIVSVKALAGFRIEVEFSDGVKGIVDLSDRLFGSVFEPLRDEAHFAEVHVDEFGAVCWPCGADLDPESLYEKLKAA